MMRLSIQQWQLLAAATGFTVTVLAGLLLWVRRRPTSDELEARRRAMLVRFGRLVDGQLLDTFDISNETGETRQMLLFSYEIAGVCYECSQDITLLLDVVQPETIRVGMPCSIRYQPGSPENSILIAESWIGLRDQSGLSQQMTRASQRGERDSREPESRKKLA